MDINLKISFRSKTKQGSEKLTSPVDFTYAFNVNFTTIGQKRKKVKLLDWFL